MRSHAAPFQRAIVGRFETPDIKEAATGRRFGPDVHRDGFDSATNTLVAERFATATPSHTAMPFAACPPACSNSPAA
jgi:hypothetical protein